MIYQDYGPLTRGPGGSEGGAPAVVYLPQIRVATQLLHVHVHAHAHVQVYTHACACAVMK